MGRDFGGVRGGDRGLSLREGYRYDVGAAASEQLHTADRVPDV